MFPLVDVGELATGGSFLIVAPHPIDELLGCGGLIAEATQRGLPVHIVMLTGGAGVLRALRDMPLRDIRRVDVLRRAETLTAIARLGGGAAMVSFLDLPEGALAADGFAFGIAVDVVAAMLRQRSAGILLAPSDADPHPDHGAAAHIARAAARAVASPPRRLAYAVSGSPGHAGHAPPRAGIAVNVGVHAARRHWALEAYRNVSGTMEEQGHAVSHPAQLRRIVARPIECFFTPED
ncbi:PIG-L deacetylase family protein [Elioraea sp.]|uniref:PIG-L deacetylase family protein n=1 Tax=Elioraea sp. TaxID=2185103 RepID=UPI0025C2F274|nr:PIG-L family deacetylase [Elioraea sp.]